MNTLFITVVLVSFLAFAQAGELDEKLAADLTKRLNKNPTVDPMDDTLLEQLEDEVDGALLVTKETLSEFQYAIYYTTDENGAIVKVDGKTTEEWGDTLRFTSGNVVPETHQKAHEAFKKSFPGLVSTSAYANLVTFLSGKQGKTVSAGVESRGSAPITGYKFVNHVVVIKISE